MARVPATALALVAALLAIAGVACGDDAPAGPQELRVRVVEPFTFDPDVLELRVGRAARITLDNSEGAERHDLAIRGLTVESGGVTVENAEHRERFSVYVLAETGQTAATAEFVPAAAGDFYFFCNIPGHIEAGMIGAVRVR